MLFGEVGQHDALSVHFQEKIEQRYRFSWNTDLVSSQHDSAAADWMRRGRQSAFAPNHVPSSKSYAVSSAEVFKSARLCVSIECNFSELTCFVDFNAVLLIAYAVVLVD